MVFDINVFFVFPGEEADGHIQQRAADGVCLLRPEPLWLSAGERPGGDPVHSGPAPLSSSGEQTLIIMGCRARIRTLILKPHHSTNLKHQEQIHIVYAVFRSAFIVS